MTATLATLNPAALVTLADCEQRIERGLRTFIDVGQALGEIRDSRLYRATHETFEEYLEQRWQMSRSYAHRMIAAAEVVLPIGNTEVPAPTNEGQARALAKVPEPERAEVWAKAVERTDGKPTAAAVREVHEERTRPTSPGPVDAAVTPPADPGATSAPDEQLIAAVLEALDGHGQFGRSVAEIWAKTAGGPHSSQIQPALDELVRRGRVAAGPSVRGTQRWLLTPELAGAPSAAQPAGSGSGEAVAPREGGGTAAPTSALAVTPEQREQIAADGERTRSINHARKIADRLVREVSGFITEIEMGAAYGEPGLFTAAMVAGLREQADRIEKYMKEQQ